MSDKKTTNPTSTRKVEANRRNAKKSTGPTTPEGKRSSARNALKHGILAQELYFADEDDQATIEALYAAYVEELQPESFLQEAAVERIAALHWKQVLVERSEAAGAAMQQHSAGWLDAVRRNEQFGLDEYSRSLDYTGQKLRSGYTRLVSKIKSVRGIRRDIERAGGIIAPTATRLLNTLGDDPEGPAMRVITRWPVPFDKLPKSMDLKRPGRPRIDHVEALKAALHTIDQHLHKMEERQEELEFHESQEAEAKRISASLPQGPSAELNLRYRKSTDSSYYRALDEYWKMKSRNHKIGTPPTDNGAVDIS